MNLKEVTTDALKKEFISRLTTDLEIPDDLDESEIENIVYAEQISSEALQKEFIQRMTDGWDIPDDMDPDELECVVYAWLLKTKLYLIGETSHQWDPDAKALLDHELKGVTHG